MLHLQTLRSEGAPQEVTAGTTGSLSLGCTRLVFLVLVAELGRGDLCPVNRVSRSLICVSLGNGLLHLVSPLRTRQTQ